jgi:hypothetical protein
MNGELPAVPLEAVLRREARRDLRAGLHERDGTLTQLERQERQDEDDRRADPWRGARHVLYRGHRVYLTAGQQLLLASTLAENGSTARVALTF